ncbi:hypothetical protein [Amphritea sp. HPY]|uniref:hypothetical protein n=1 Tax=Amphritea sp. HPY TaxID=3421652 RepID=UPI003D7E941D
MAKKTITTPRGTARYPWLNTADTKFGDPKYKVDLMVESGSVGDFGAKIEDALEDHFNAILDKEQGGKYREIFKAELPFFEDGGETLFRCSLNKIGKSKKTGETWENKITFYDAKGRPIPEGMAPKIGGASILRVSCELNTWTRPNVEGRGSAKVTDLEVGISLRIKGVQVIEAKQGGNGPASAESMGFGEEEGYSYDPDAFDADEGGNDAGDF